MKEKLKLVEKKDMDVHTKNCLRKAGLQVLQVGIAFAGGCLVGYVGKKNIPLTGAIFAIVVIAKIAFDELTAFFAHKYHWKQSTHLFVQAAVGLAFTIAGLVTAFSLKIIGLVGLSIGVIGGLVVPAIQLSLGIRAICLNQDRVYKGAYCYA